MDFIDNQAEESENDDHSDASGSEVDEPKPKKRKIKEKKSKRIESSDDDDDEDDDDEGREEMKGFIADEEEEEEDDDVKSEEKSDKDDDLDELDDDDLDLIDENLDRRQARESNRVELADSDEDDQQRIGRNLFDNGRDSDDEASERGGARRRGSGDEYSDSERSEDNFIEDDGDGPKRHKRHRHRRDENIPEGAADDARDIFGVEDFNFDEFYEDDDVEDGIDEEEEEEIIEDDGEGGEIKIRRSRSQFKKQTLLESIEPSELDKGFLGAADKKIMMEDAPERFQLRRTPVTECDDDELDREAKWIFKYAFDTRTVSDQVIAKENDKLEGLSGEIGEEADMKKEEIISSIREVLRFIRVKNNSFEVPFIAFYRKECIDQRLNMNNLWTVYDFDEKWCHMNDKKNKLTNLFERMKFYQENSDDVMAARRPITETDIIDIKFIETFEQLTDVHANFQLLYGGSLEAMTNWEKMNKSEEDGEEEEYKVKFRASIRNDKYKMCVENGIGELAGRFGLTAKQFAENLDWKKHEVEQDEELPLDAAEAYICSSFPDREMVLNGAKFMLAKEISRQPMVREKVRRETRNTAKIYVRPTKKGRDTLDDSHPMYYKRYIREKPVSNLKDDEFLWYHKMKEEGLIDLMLTCDTDEDKVQGNTLADRLLVDQPFHRDEYTQLVEEWNAVRNECVRMAITEMLVPYMIDELYSTLLDEAKSSVVQSCRIALASRIKHAGFVPQKIDDDDEDEEEMDHHGSKRIMAIAYPPGKDEATFGVMVDENGVVVDYLRMVHFTKRSFANGPTRELKKESMDLFKKFVQRRRPHVIGLNIEDIECQRLKRDIEEALQEIQSEGLISRIPPVVLMDTEVAKVYMKSNSALSEHPDYPHILRQAVSMARCLLDPIPEYTHLWNSDDDFFCLSFHPLQRDIEQELLANGLLHEIMNKVNEVGVDVNKCVEFPHHTNQLQFVCGLGPRKAASLLKYIKLNDNLIESRTKLVTTCKLGPKVFMNCAGFIRIDTEKVSERTDAYVEVLDGSRVHPETYEWARKMAVDALEVDDSADPTTALMEIMESPDRLKDLDLDAFAEELNRQGFGEKKATLYDIASELTTRYKDLRDPFEELSNEMLFDLINKSGKEIHEGQRVLGTVQAVQYKKIDISQRLPETDSNGMFRCAYCKQFSAEDPGTIQEHISSQDRRTGCPGTPVGIKVRLDNGLTGFCPNKNISKDHIDDPLTRVKLNQPYWFRVINVNKERFSYILSCRSSDLQTNSNIMDDYFDADMAAYDEQEAISEKMRKNEANTRVKRVISHPNFHNISYEEAVKMLDSMDWTECIIRPSSNKDSSLSVTWKIANNIYHNFFVKESAKDQIFSIGKQLTVGDEEFEDLNELIARFVQPMIQISHEITSHKYFFNNEPSENIPAVEEFVRMKRHELGRNAYVFSASQKRPCQFCISYQFDNTGRIRHEYFTIHPRGIRFRHQNFDSLDHMMVWFKKHFNERPIDQMRRGYPTSASHILHTGHHSQHTYARPAKHGNVQSMISADDVFAKRSTKIEEIVLDDDSDEEFVRTKPKSIVKCEMCHKDMSSWSKIRRESHRIDCKKKTELRNSKKINVDLEVKEEDAKKWMTTDDIKYSAIENCEEANRKRKRPRSYAVVELAPRECQCEVLTTLHKRFLDNFAVRKSSKSSQISENLSENAFQLKSLIDKVARFEQLSIDMRKLMEDGETCDESPILLKCLDGEMKCRRNVLKHRTTLFNRNNLHEKMFEIQHKKEVVRHWLAYVFCAQIEWDGSQKDEIFDLAEKYGPADLPKRLIEKEMEKKSLREIDKQIFQQVVPENGPEPVDVDPFDNDDPLCGFGMNSNLSFANDSFCTPMNIRRRSSAVKTDEKNIDSFVTSNIRERESEPLESENLDGPVTEVLQSTSFVLPEDSFDNWQPPVYEQICSNSVIESIGDDDIIADNDVPKTPQNIQNIEKLAFGSNVKILKTDEITPMPNYDSMDENELKEQVKAIGQRPRGRKKMIEILKKAYETLHPVINPYTPTIRPIQHIEKSKPEEVPKKRIKPSLAARFSPQKPANNSIEDIEDDADKTLNMSDEVVLMEDGIAEEEELTQTCVNSKHDIEGMRKAFVEWIKLPENVELYNHVLSLHPVSLEEMLARLGKADGPVSIIGKAKLATILDSLSITFQLPQKGGARRAGGAAPKFSRRKC
ncbi:unnamed protein product [Caenorhabditis bovis]|uniref:Suppressor of Ty 6 homolog n=1 Tax=Caenorhabditis bovis TaxID=2654633 RepID=A0A8S1ESR1_9PELO|nr:unnamed protein product [Caenorhabditis bovis]